MNWISRIKIFKPIKVKKIKSIENRLKYLRYKEDARRLIESRVVKFNEFYGFNYNRISIRDQKTRWGSCSRQGNLNFSYRLLFLPNHLINYIVVHELCHLKEFNHSFKFWNLVEQTIPDYIKNKKELRKNIF